MQADSRTPGQTPAAMVQDRNTGRLPLSTTRAALATANSLRLVSSHTLG